MIPLHNPPRALITKIYVALGESNKEKMITHLYGDNDALLDNAEELFESYLKNLVKEHIYSKQSPEKKMREISAEVRNTYHRRRQLTKRNWFKALQRDIENNKKTPIHQEIDVLKKLLERKKNKEEVIKVFSGNKMDIKEPEDLLNVRLLEIEEWSKDRNTLLTEYPYLETKTNYQLERAFETDLIYIASDIVYKNPEGFITKYPEEQANYPVFSHASMTVKGNLRFSPDSKNIELYDEIPLSNGSKFISSFIQANNNEQVRATKLPLLDDIDNKIYLFFLKNIDQSFYTKQTVEVGFRDLVTSVYGSDSKKAYKLTEARIYKFLDFQFSCEVVNEKNERVRKLSFNLFQSVDMKKDDADNKLKVKITFSDHLYHQIINDQTINIYSHIIDKLENSLSRILVFAFQKERIDAFLENRPPRKHYEYTFFTDRVRFRKKDMEANLKLVEAALNEFVSLHALIKDFKRIKNGFEITLFSLTENEQIDLFSDSRKHKLLG